MAVIVDLECINQYVLDRLSVLSPSAYLMLVHSEKIICPPCISLLCALSLAMLTAAGYLVSKIIKIVKNI